MLLLDCPACGRRELRSLRSIERLDNTTDGIIVTLRCAACRHRCRIVTGRQRVRREPAGSQTSALNIPKRYDEASVFRPENLLREGRRQRRLADIPVPAVCLLDPDGDVARHLQSTGTGEPHPGWACYHTELWVTRPAGTQLELGVIGRAVGAPFAVLVAEQLRVSGCQLLISVASAGQITPLDQPPYFVLLERAWRDEGTSQHYTPPSTWAHLAPHLTDRLTRGLTRGPEPVHRGVSWTTDAPYRETPSALAVAGAAGCHTVEMEAAALYAYAQARRHDVVCLAHVTNTLAVNGNDFNKGDHDGTHRILNLTVTIARALHRPGTPPPSTTDPPTPNAGRRGSSRTPHDHALQGKRTATVAGRFPAEGDGNFKGVTPSLEATPSV